MLSVNSEAKRGGLVGNKMKNVQQAKDFLFNVHYGSFSIYYKIQPVHP
jgi:hypothetical protein